MAIYESTIDRIRRERQLMEESDLGFAKKFKEEFPPGSSVWANQWHTMSGDTVGGKGIYVDPHDLYVFANKLVVDGERLKDSAYEYKFSALLVEAKGP